MTIANQITILRILLIPVFVGLLLYYDAGVRAGEADNLWRYAAFAVFVFAAVSDVVDGYLARHHGQATALGAVLDPIADKLLMLAALVTLSFIGIAGSWQLPIWFGVIIIGRDAILLLGFLLLHYFHVKVRVRPHWTGKAATFFTFLAISGALLDWSGTFYLCVLGGMAAVFALILYLRTGLQAFIAAGHADPSQSGER